ncbi:unnamed protein product [Victoria cruziana]
MESAGGMENSSMMTARPMFAPENSLMGLPFAGDFDLLDGRERTTGFMELLGVSDSDFSASFFGSALQQHFKGEISSPYPANNSREGVELTDASSTVPTPNSSTSSSSAEANDDESNSREGKQRLVENERREKEKRSETPKKKGTKREREPRFAFMTRSDVDHLEDGYRWRKYGQKAVKNSPFPRSYYRCTSAKCGVKKRVERSCNDPSIVITTYEGQHTHHSPVAGRPSTIPPLHMQLETRPPVSQLLQQQQQKHSQRPQYALGSHALRTSVAAAAPLQQRDYGLLQDILTPRTRE